VLALVDWIIIGILGISTLMSIRRGFVKEALSLFTWIAAVIVARLFSGQFSVLLEPHIDTASLRLGASYLILFVGTLIVGGMVNFIVGEFVKMTGLTGTDRFLGMFFGFARGAIIILLFVAGLHYLAPVQEDTWYQESRLIPEIVKVVEDLGPVLWEQGEQLLQEVKNPTLPAEAS
jgi:membrane protein required for colicin V production